MKCEPLEHDIIGVIQTEQLHLRYPRIPTITRRTELQGQLTGAEIKGIFWTL